MRVLLPEIPQIPDKHNGHAGAENDIFRDSFESSEVDDNIYGGTILIETDNPQPSSRTPTRAKSRRPRSGVDSCSFLSCGSLPSQSCTSARETTCAGPASVFCDTWPAVDVYEYGYLPERPCSRANLPPETPRQRVHWGTMYTTPSNREEEGATKTYSGEAPAGHHRVKEADVSPPRDDGEMQQRPTAPPPAPLQPIVGRSIGLTQCRMPQISSRVYGGIDGAKDPRDSKKTMFSRQSASASSSRAPGHKEIVDTVVPKTTVEERLKFVDLEFVQDVEKFVEVPEVFYNDVIVEVPQVVEVVKIVPKAEIRENITYVPRFETKYIPKYVEVPIIKIVDRYEEVDEIHEVLKPVVKRSVVDCPKGVLKKVANTIHKKVLTEKPVPVVKYENVPVYKQKFEPKIIKEEFLNQKPHFIDIPVPYEKPVIKYVDQPYFVNRYRNNVVPIPLAPRVTPVFRQGHHTEVVEVPLPSPYLVTHTAHNYRPPAKNYQVGSAQGLGYRVGDYPNMTLEQYGAFWG